MKTKLVDEEVWRSLATRCIVAQSLLQVWLRYEVSLDSNQMHDVRKTAKSTHSNVMNVASVIANNVTHLSNWRESERSGGMMF